MLTPSALEQAQGFQYARVVGTVIDHVEILVAEQMTVPSEPRMQTQIFVTLHQDTSDAQFI
jgi:hypothetical protein